MSNFVIVGDQSHAMKSLATCLKTIPDTTVFGELFSRLDPDAMEQFAEDNVLIQMDQDPIDFLTDQVFQREGSTGFLLAQNQARCAAWSQVWGFIRKNTQIVHAVQSPIQSILAKSRAFYIYVDPTEFTNIIKKFEMDQADIKSYFKLATMISISIDKIEDQWNDLLWFLELPYIDIASQDKTDPKARIENYRDLVKALQDTPYLPYLTQE
jgi:hypothetical protein